MDTTTKKIGIGSILGYVVGIMFFLASLGAIATPGMGLFVGIFYVLAGLSVFPPFWKFVKKKYNYEITRSLKIVAFIVLFTIAGVISPTTHKLTEQVNKLESTAPTAIETKNVETKVTPTATPVEKEPISLSGTGQQATKEFYLDKGLVRFELTHNGRGYFGIWLMDTEGNRIESLVNEVNPFNGSKAVRIDKSGNYLLDISADGPWTVVIK